MGNVVLVRFIHVLIRDLRRGFKDTAWERGDLHLRREMALGVFSFNMLAKVVIAVHQGV